MCTNTPVFVCVFVCVLSIEGKWWDESCGVKDGDGDLRANSECGTSHIFSSDRRENADHFFTLLSAMTDSADWFYSLVPPPPPTHTSAENKHTLTARGENVFPHRLTSNILPLPLAALSRLFLGWQSTCLIWSGSNFHTAPLSECSPATDCHCIRSNCHRSTETFL